MKTLQTLLAAAFLLAPLAALGAQDALITVEQAALRERPTLDSKIIESKAAGTKVRVSQYNKDGWYKTKTSTGQFGWIWQADLTILDYRSDVKAAQLEMEEKGHERRGQRGLPWLFLRVGGGMFVLISSEISSRLGLGPGHWYLSPGAFGEIAVRIEERLRLAVRLSSFSNSTSVTHNQVAYTVDQSVTPFLVGLDADVSQSDQFDISAGFYAGFSLANELTVHATTFQAPNSFAINTSSYALQANFTGKYYLAKWLQAVFEFGILYTQIPSTQLTTAFNGDGQFRTPENQLTTVRSNMVGPIFALGLQFAL